MTIEEIQEAKEAWNKMQEKADKAIEQSRKEIFIKHGFEDTCFKTDTPEDIKNIIWKELNEAEEAIRKEYPYYTDWTEELCGATLFYNYLLYRIDPEAIKIEN